MDDVSASGANGGKKIPFSFIKDFKETVEENTNVACYHDKNYNVAQAVAWHFYPNMLLL